MSASNFIVEKFDAIVDALHRKRRISRAYAHVFGTPDGEIVLNHIIQNGFVTKSTFVQGDPEQTMLNEGSRRMALSIMRMARGSSEQVKQIERELTERGIEL